MAFTAALLGAVTLSWNASAQEANEGRSYLNQLVPAPSKSFELKLATGYTQGLGNVAPNRGINDVAGAGIGIGIDADYRITPANSVGIEAQYQEFTTPNNLGSRGLAVNVGATYHLSPHTRGDGWVRMGTGYRMLWDVHPGGDLAVTNMYHGFDLITLKVGYDIRTSSDVALSPVVGADLQTFGFQNADVLSSVQFGTFIYAGIQGRFGATTPSSGSGVVVTSSR